MARAHPGGASRPGDAAAGRGGGEAGVVGRRGEGKHPMTYPVAVMYAVATLLTIAGAWMLLRLRSASISERRTYAYRMVGIMLASAGIVLLISATAMRQWSIEP